MPMKMPYRLLIVAEGEMGVGVGGEAGLDGAGSGAILGEAGVLHEAGIPSRLLDVERLAILDPRRKLIDDPVRLRGRHRLEDDEHRVAAQETDMRIGEELMHVGDAALDVPLLARQ